MVKALKNEEYNKKLLKSFTSVVSIDKSFNSFKKIAFIGVGFSAISTILTILLIPFLYNHIQYARSLTEDEILFCKTRIANV